MKLNEQHHAAIVLAFYRALRDEYGETGLLAFSMAQRLYGEQRGRRMALRALRDGHKLGYTEYVAYSEWECTPEFFDVTMDARPGCVDECVTRCPWADVFRAAGEPECGERYCADIDRSIVRGFNPELRLDLDETQHSGGACRFHFRDEGVTPDLFESGDALKKGETILPFTYHCAHVWRAYCDIISDVFGDAGCTLISHVRGDLHKAYGDAFFKALDTFSEMDFNRLPVFTTD